ncbi:hypothetical protein TNCV_1692271 [Trichonephila clavipes]|nr:hypothetical protein TNCV_1692271 [Trichonephila clavipes]
MKMMALELASPSPNFHTTPTGGGLNLNRFNMHLSWRVFSGTRLELMTPDTGQCKGERNVRCDLAPRWWYWARTHDMPAMMRYLDHWAAAFLHSGMGRKLLVKDV